MNIQDQEKIMEDLFKKYSEPFGLKAFPGLKFQVVESASFWSRVENEPILYIFKIEDDGSLVAWCKGTASELEKNCVKL